MLSINEYPFLVGAAGLAAVASVVSACAVIFGTNPHSNAHIMIYKGGLSIAAILLAISIATAAFILIW